MLLSCIRQVFPSTWCSRWLCCGSRHSVHPLCSNMWLRGHFPNKATRAGQGGSGAPGSTWSMPPGPYTVVARASRVLPSSRMLLTPPWLLGIRIWALARLAWKIILGSEKKKKWHLIPCKTSIKSSITHYNCPLTAKNAEFSAFCCQYWFFSICL